ncbi:hypothetical protein ACTXMZ_15625 [Brachybacterium alimentarium]|uniref:hypothetical protein n=1 Tax=Brachybacterium alimentarium TaxID=47845 RepID=UPI003FD1048D
MPENIRSTFREVGTDEVRADMQEEHDQAIEAGFDPMYLYRGHLLRARLLKEIIDREARA